MVINPTSGYLQLLIRISLPGGRYERRFEIEIRPQASAAFVVAKKVPGFLLFSLSASIRHLR